MQLRYVQIECSCGVMYPVLIIDTTQIEAVTIIPAVFPITYKHGGHYYL